MAESDKASSGRVKGLREFATPTLEAVEKRRGQLWLIASVVLIGLAGIMVLLTFEDSPIKDLDFLPLFQIRILFVGLVAVLAAYLFDKELKLRTMTHNLVDERVLSAALSNRLKELTVLSEVGKAINKLLDVDDVLRLILQSALDLLEADEGSVMLLEPDGETLKVACSKSSKSDVVEGAEVKMGQGVAGWVAQNRESLLLAGKAPEGMFEGFETKDRQIPSAVSVPLISSEELFGVLNINAQSGEREFTEYDLRAVQLFAEHAAIAIRNARSFGQERQTIARLEELDRMKTEFVASVSHELRTPLTSIIGSAKTIRQRSGQLSEEQEGEFMMAIERQAARLLRMVEEILSAAKIEAGAPKFSRELMDLSKLIREITIGIEATSPKNPLQLEAPERVELFGDPSVIEQVVTNLIDNAIKYSDNSEPIVIRLLEQPGEVTVQVADKGRGIRESDLPNIFDRFRQVDDETVERRGGVGLGLYIVKNLVEAVGGTIEVTSALGEGSTFRVRLPKRKEAD